MNNKLVKIGGIFIVLMALAALIGSTMTFAQDDAPNVTPPTLPDNGSEATLPGGPMNRPHGRFGGPRFFNGEAYDAALADELNITVEELAAARQAAKETVLQQLVAEGTITQAQADAILSDEGLRSLGPLVTPEAMEAVIAEALGISVDELQAARAAGKRLPELAEELGVSLEDVQAAVQAAHEAAIAQAVEDGLLTQAQADRLLENGAMPHFGPHGGGFRQGGGFGGPHGGPHGGFGPGAPQGNPFNNAPPAPQG